MIMVPTPTFHSASIFCNTSDRGGWSEEHNKPFAVARLLYSERRTHTRE